MNPVIPVFISSPEDVGDERKLTERTVHELAPRLARLFGVTVVPLLWEQFAPLSSFDATHPQTGILQRIEPFSIFVGIVGNRYGTPVPGERGRSGTELEFFQALEHRARISILTYFKQWDGAVPEDGHEREQREKIAGLQKRLKAKKVHLATFSTTEELRERLFGDLMEAALKLILSGEPRKVNDYIKFFRFGSNYRVRSRPLLIVYPPVTDPGKGHEEPIYNWQERLLPHVIYEDSKAIQDFEEAMRLVGREYKTVTTNSPDLDMAEPGDRIWVCVPRNRRAAEVLERLGDRVRFEFVSVENGAESRELRLIWHRTEDERIEIRSPLRRYLERSNRPGHRAPWSPLYGYAYGKDYAVFARFRVPRSWNASRRKDTETFYHYFVGGIRGLGTWGVGHLVDHESSALLAMAEASMKGRSNEDVQILLEVTYENFRITEVSDVSDKKASYFAERDRDEFIDEQLEKRRDWLPMDPERPGGDEPSDPCSGEGSDGDDAPRTTPDPRGGEDAA